MVRSPYKTSNSKTVSDYPKLAENKDRYRHTETAADIVYPGKNQQTYVGLWGGKS